MAQARREPPAPPRRVRANDWSAMGGPVLPGEFRPLAPVPASSDSGEPPYLPEQELLRQLIRYYRWAWVGAGELKRYNPHGRAIRAEVEALGDE
jgi:hypothetical protein